MNAMQRAPILAALVACLAASCGPSAPSPRALAAYAAIDPDRPFPESSFSEIGGIRVHYRRFMLDAPSGRVALLLHGFGASTFSFRYTVPALLGAGIEAIAADWPPFGFSEKGPALEELGYERAALFWGLVDALGIEGKLIIVGHSMGGRFITAMEAARPDRVEALVYIAGAVNGEGRDPGILRGLASSLAQGIAGDWERVRRILAEVYKAPVSDEEVDGYVAPFQAPGAAKAFEAFLAIEARQRPLEPKGVKAPSLLIWGSDDAVIPLSQGRRLLSDIEGARLEIIEGAGHCPHETRAEEVNALLLGFLSGIH